MASNLDEKNIVKAPLFTPDLAQLRKLATVIVGELPQGLNIIRIADTTRPASVVVKGGDPKRKIKLERTAYQLEYTNGTIMLDSGMDEATHLHFGKGGNFYPDSYATLQQALKKANMIVLSHYHGDHVAGVVRSPYFDEIAHKVWTSTKTAELMINRPHKPTLKIAADKVNQFMISDFDTYQPIAPGIVAINTPGHSADSKMFYIRLQSGQEFIHSVDTGWAMENITRNSMKNASWIKEDEKQIMAQFAWLNRLMATEKDLIVLCAHDSGQYINLRKQGILGDIV
nr:MBL fold metallo-hydrolase [Shewanella pneumatophori]